jgi:hypothetical protein
MNLMNLWRGFSADDRVFTLSALDLPLNEVNVVNVGERLKSAMFITYPHESKGPVNVVNVARGYFALRRTLYAKRKILRRNSAASE